MGDPPFTHTTINMAQNGKSRISNKGLSVEIIDHLVDYHYLSKQQKEVQCYYGLASMRVY